MENETGIKENIEAIKSLLGKILEKNNGVLPNDLPGLEIELPPFRNNAE